MTNFKNALIYGLVLILAVFILILFFSDIIFGDLIYTESLNPLFIVIPAMALLLYFLIKKTEK